MIDDPVRVPYDVKQEIATSCRAYAGAQSRVRSVLLPLLKKYQVTAGTFFDATSAIDRYRTTILSDPEVWRTLPGFSWGPRDLEPFLNAWVIATGEYRYTLFGSEAIFTKVKWTPAFLRTCIANKWAVLEDMTSAQYQCLGPATRLAVLRLLLKEEISTAKTAWKNILGDPSIGTETLVGLFRSTSRVKQEKRIPQGALVLRCLLRRIEWTPIGAESDWNDVMRIVEKVSGGDTQVEVHLLACALQNEPSISTAKLGNHWIYRLRSAVDFNVLAPRLWGDRVSGSNAYYLLDLLGDYLSSADGVVAVATHKGLPVSVRGSFFIKKLPLIGWEFDIGHANSIYDDPGLRPVLAMLLARPELHGMDMADCGWTREVFGWDEPGNRSVLEVHAPEAARNLPLVESLDLTLLQWWESSYADETSSSLDLPSGIAT